MSSMSGPICPWDDWATSVGNEEEKSEVCMCVMCMTVAAGSQGPLSHMPKNTSAGINKFMARCFDLTGQFAPTLI